MTIQLLDATSAAADPLAFNHLSDANHRCMHRLRAAPPPRSYSHVPRRNQAAVAAILFEGSDGELQVIMTTRALHLRSHPGQASLPGGKMDSTDNDVAHTALRESCEEIGLDPAGVVHLHTADPFLSKTALLVHPVVFYLGGGQAALRHLVASPSEVDLIWSTPLQQFLSSTPPEHLVPHLADPNTVDVHRPPQSAFRTYTDVPWISGSYRMHRFRSQHQLIKGLTADVLIHVASIAYGRPPAFQVAATDQLSWSDMVDRVIQRLERGQRGDKRWGDGESGDAYGSSEAYATVIGLDDQ
ncbi:8-oxo-dGTP diphosphatase [Thecaphora frezii]